MMIPSAKQLLSFIILFLLLHEAHELAHHLCVVLLCGCWGVRDFLNWHLCDTCSFPNAHIIVGMAGPILTYSIMWIGFSLLHSSKTSRQQQLGFFLVMGSLPLPRILGAIGKGGDEISTMRQLFAEESFKGQSVLLGGLMVLLLTLPPLWRAFKSIRNKPQVIVFLAYLVLPWVMDWLIVTRLLNGVLVPSGVLMQPVYFGEPVLVIAWQLLLVVAFLVFRVSNTLATPQPPVPSER